MDLDRVLDQCLETAATPELWPVALGALATALGCRGALISRPNRNHIGIIYSPGMEEVSDLFFGEKWNLRDLRADRALQRGPGAITADQHVISADDIRTSHYYNGFAKRADVPWFAAFGTVAPGDAFVGLSFQRSRRQGAFSRIELAAISRAVPRLRQAMNLSAVVSSSRGTGHLQGLALVDQAAVLIGDNCELVDSNAAANAILADGTVLRRGQRGLAAVHPGYRQKVEQYLSSACGNSAEANQISSLPLAVTGTDGSTVILQASPVVGEANAVFGVGKCVVMITQVGGGRPASGQRLKVAFGLTDTEARVAVALATGRPVRVLAEGLGMSEAAVRFHIKSILPKADVRTTAAFVAAATTLG